MLRRPTPLDEIYRWHRAALHGECPPVHGSEPHAGWFLARLEWTGNPRTSPLLPGSIWLEQPIDPETGELTGDEMLRAEIMGEELDVLDAWTMLAKRPICKLFYMQRLGQLL